jgi:hypothetical protein
MRVEIRLSRILGFVLAGVLAGSNQPVQAQQGSIAGKVTDAATADPLENARVILVGPNRIEATGRDGRYTFRNVPPGNYQIRVLRLGYRPATDSVVAAAGETVALDFRLSPSPRPGNRAGSKSETRLRRSMPRKWPKRHPSPNSEIC